MALEPHGILPEINHDEGAREGFVFSFKSALLGHSTPANRTVYEKAALPAFQRQHGRVSHRDSRRPLAACRSPSAGG